MRIAWLTPLSERTGIAAYSLAAVAALRFEHDVDIWVEPTPDRLDAAIAGVLRDDEATAETLGAYDLVVYNIGNNVEFHDVIYAISRDLPGLVIVHDKVLQDLVFPHYVERRRDVAGYLALMARFYGEPGIDYAMRRVRGQASDELTARFPAVEFALQNAAGVVAHSDEAARLFDRYPDLVPVGRVNLLFDPCIAPVGETLDASISGSMTIVVHGNIVPSKRIESVLDAIAGSEPLRSGSRLRIVGGGSPAYVSVLRDRVHRLGIDAMVEFTGRVDAGTMQRHLSEADVFVNLRYPSTEVASAALVEQIMFAKPVIVSDLGFYGELPDEVAIKIHLSHDVEELRAALERLLVDPALRMDMARAARAFGDEAFSPERYRSDFSKITARTEAALPLVRQARDAARSLAASPYSEWSARALEAGRRLIGDQPAE